VPELPEVETIVRQLNKKAKNLTVKDACFYWRKILKKGIPASRFSKSIKEKKILKVRRKGKNILIDLSGGLTLLIHLKLTGRLLFGEKSFIEKDPYLRFHLELSKNKILVLSDLRKFAKIILDKTEKIENLKELKELGPEPLASDLSIDRFASLINKKKKKIKDWLMDQTMISGIGNIYANEILWEAKVNPFKLASALEKREITKIYQAIKKVLLLAIKNKGATISDEMYRDISGNPGEYGEKRKIYQRQGEKCQRCKAIIKKTVISARSAFYCPKCQK